MNQRPHILLSNDDGIHAPGLRALAEALRDTADLTIVAPSHENSGMGHAITVFRDLHFAPVHQDGQLWGWGLNGTPADCVKVAIHLLGRDRPFDAVISGVNCGQNAGVNVLYSGTVAAAREAAIYGLPAMAVSLLYHDEEHMFYDTAARAADEILAVLLRNGLPRGMMLNVNVPPVPYEQLAGWAITRMGDSGYEDYFELQEQAAKHHEEIPAGIPGVARQMEVEATFNKKKKKSELGALGTERQISTPPHATAGPATFRNIGNGMYRSSEQAADLDDHALFENKISITPLQFDLTAYGFLPELAGWFETKK